MTVEEGSAASGGYWCQWFAGKKLERGNFPAESLEPVESNERIKP